MTLARKTFTKALRKQASERYCRILQEALGIAVPAVCHDPERSITNTVVVATIAGPMRTNFRISKQSIHIYCQFRSRPTRDLPAGYANLNPHSFKWNVYVGIGPDGDPERAIEAVLDDLEARFKALDPKAASVSVSV